MPKKKISEQTTKEIQVRTPEDISSIPFQAMDQADDDSMSAFFRGMPSEILDKWVYEFKAGDGKIVKGLSWTGTKEASVWLAKLGKKSRMIISEEPQFTKVEEISVDGQKFCDAIVVYKDLDTGRTVSGNARQSYLRKSGRKQDMEFVPRMALSKAQRNAIQKLIPQQTILLFVEYAKKQGKVQSLMMAKDQTTLTPEEMKIALPYLSRVEEFNTLEELREYFTHMKKQTPLGAKIILSVTTSIQIRAQNIKNEQAKKKIKEIAEKEKINEKESEKLANDVEKGLKK